MQFLALVDSGDYEAAAATSTCGLGISPSNLQEIFGGQDISYNLTNSSISNGTSATVSGSIEVPTRRYTEVSLGLLKFGDNWNVCTLVVS